MEAEGQWRREGEWRRRASGGEGRMEADGVAQLHERAQGATWSSWTRLERLSDPVAHSSTIEPRAPLGLERLSDRDKCRAGRRQPLRTSPSGARRGALDALSIEPACVLFQPEPRG